ncbi:glycosyltransferase family 4 protein [Sphingobacterium kitahiroshimense]|uniref:Glycosyltransferase family 4 protein n=1 Tax=Sphingobacterium kitahiroshimense TaxID=470446 RepID=A0ABV0C0W5_9SPHI
MKVLHVINSLHTGGAEQLLVSTLPLMEKHHVDVDLLLLNGDRTPFYHKLEKESNIQIKSFGKSYYNPLYIIKLIPYLNKYDLIHVHLFPAMYFVALAKLLSFSKTKLVFTEHSTSNKRLQNRMYFPFERLIYSLYTSVICISESVRETLVDMFNNHVGKYEVIENGINLENIARAVASSRSEFNFTDQDKLICMVAGFRKEKDHDTVVRALKHLPEHYKLLFVGSGEREEDIKRLTTTLGVSHRITFLGVRTDIFSLVKMCDIAVLSSHWEGFGLAAAEAMACGIPTIASNVNGLSQVVSGGGLLFEKGDELELADLISSLEDILFYNEISANGKMKAQSYDLSNMVRKTISLYNKIIGKTSNSTLNHKKNEG